MADNEEHYAIVEVQDPENADVTVEGSEGDIFNFMEALDVDTLLQRELSQAKEDLDANVEVIPRKGLQGIARKAKDDE